VDAVHRAHARAALMRSISPCPLTSAGRSRPLSPAPSRLGVGGRNCRCRAYPPSRALSWGVAMYARTSIGRPAGDAAV